MLVLSRKRDEVICIGPDIRIQVVDIRGDKVRLGITAPRSVVVDREEVFDRWGQDLGEASEGTIDPYNY